MANFSKQFEIIYEKFAQEASARGYHASKLALAKFLGISQGRLQSWERGQVPKADDLRLLNEKLGFSFRWMISGEGQPLDDEPRNNEEMNSLRTKIDELEKELKAVNHLNRQLTARLLIDGVGDKSAVTNIGKAADGHE